MVVNRVEMYGFVVLYSALCQDAVGDTTKINETVTALKEFIKCKRQTHN